METVFTLVIAAIVGAIAWYKFRKTQKENDDRNRALEERNNRQAEAEERRRLFEERYRQ